MNQTRLYKCQKCPKTFSEVDSLQSHLFTHLDAAPSLNQKQNEGSRKFLCTDCGVAFVSKASLDQHRRIHVERKNFLCNFCAKTFLSKGQLDVHERKHSGAKPFICSDCGKGFAYRESLVTHSTIHSGIRPYLCLYCGKTFSCVGNLLKHKRRKVNTCGAPEFNTENKKVAPRVKTKGKNVEAHVRRSKKKKAIKVEVNFEEQELFPEALIEDVVEQEEYEMPVVEDFKEEDPDEVEYFRLNDPNFDCQKCHKSFDSLKEIIQHLKEHHNIDLQIINVAHDPQEPQKTIDIGPDLQHFKKAFDCNKCQRKFSSKTLLNSHEASKCGKEPIHICDQCGKGYASAGSLKTHKTVHTGELKYSCDYCSKQFRTAGQVRIHVRRHTGQKPFLCQFCEKSFAFRESLLTHETTHTGVKRFGCACGQKFSCISNLKAHRKSNEKCAQFPMITKPLNSEK